MGLKKRRIFVVTVLVEIPGPCKYVSRNRVETVKGTLFTYLVLKTQVRLSKTICVTLIRGLF